MPDHTDLVALLAPIRPQMEGVERLLRERTAAIGEPLGPALWRAVAGGKRLRPALVLLAGGALGCGDEGLRSLAAAVDLLHAATLIHDDVVDASPTRRGRRALHTLWPTAAGVLAGDYLLAEAIDLLAGLGRPRLVQVLADTLRTLCGGEIGQMLARREGVHPTREGCLRSSEAKTASLFAACSEMAAHLAGAAAAQVTALRGYGLELGLAYQIIDDVLDLAGDEATLGKPPGSDLRQGLITLPILCYLERTPAGGDDPVRAALAGLPDEGRLQAALAAIRASEAIEEALAEANAHAEQAQQALTELAPSDCRDSLHALAAYVMQRSLYARGNGLPPSPDSAP